MPLVYLLIVAVAVAITIFAVQNADQVTIRFLVWRIERAPLAAVILASGGVGGILVGLIGFVQRWKLRSKVRQLETRLRGLEATKPD